MKAFTKIFFISSGFILPGWGQIYLGKMSTALYLQLSLTSVIYLFSLTRWITLKEYIPLLICILLAIHLNSGTNVALIIKSEEINIKKKGIIPFILYPILIIPIAFILFIFKSSIFGVEIYQISEKSMWPSLMPNDYVLADTWLYDREKVIPKDVIFFKNVNQYRGIYVKRVHEIPESLKNKMLRGIYVLGDNKPYSLDSRVFGLVDHKNILGKAQFILYPISRFGEIP